MITKDYDKNNNEIDKNSILFINAAKGYMYDGLVGSGYKSIHPYNYKTILGRVILELCVKLHLSHEFLFNKSILDFNCRYIFVYDSIITKQFLKWLVRNKPNVKIIFSYTNLVGKARNVNPEDIPKKISVWTYDKNDAVHYHINLTDFGGYSTSFIGDKRKKKYDVVYVGRDKGRAEFLIKLEKELQQLGLKTRFLIMPDTRASKRKSYYSNEISYSEVINLVTSSKAVLNIVLPGQVGVTMRDYESLFNRVKLITNNKSLQNQEFYNSENIFILGERNINELKEFINSPYQDIDDEILKKCTLSSQILEIIKKVDNVDKG